MLVMAISCRSSPDWLSWLTRFHADNVYGLCSMGNGLWAILYAIRPLYHRVYVICDSFLFRRIFVLLLEYECRHKWSEWRRILDILRMLLLWLAIRILPFLIDSIFHFYLFRCIPRPSTVSAARAVINFKLHDTYILLLVASRRRLHLTSLI